MRLSLFVHRKTLHDILQRPIQKFFEMHAQESAIVSTILYLTDAIPRHLDSSLVMLLLLMVWQCLMQKLVILNMSSYSALFLNISFSCITINNNYYSINSEQQYGMTIMFVLRIIGFGWVGSVVYLTWRGGVFVNNLSYNINVLDLKMLPPRLEQKDTHRYGTFRLNITPALSLSSRIAKL